MASDTRRAVAIVAPHFSSLARHGQGTSESPFRLKTRPGEPASITNLDTLINSTLRDPPLGTGLDTSGPMAAYYLESFLKTRGYRAESIVNWDGPDALSRAMDNDPIAILFSTTFVTSAPALQSCLREIRQCAGGTPIIAGGPFVNGQARLLRTMGSRRARALESFGVDREGEMLFSGADNPSLDGCIFVASPQGEHTLQIVLEQLQGGASTAELAKTPNLVLPGTDGEWIYTGHASEPVDLDGEYTRWDLIDHMPSVVPIRANTGCDQGCRFCNFRTLHRGVTSRDTRSVMAEIGLAMARGGGFFNVIDEDVLAGYDRGRDLPGALIREELDVVWGGFLQAGRVTEDNAESILKSGFRYGLAGVESGHRQQQRRMGKKTDPEDVARGTALLLEGGALVDLTFVLGFPGETPDTLEATAGFIESIPRGKKGHASYELFPFELFPGTVADTPAFRAKYDLRGSKTDWSHQTMNFGQVVDDFSPMVFSQVRSTPYHHGGMDAPGWWNPERRDRAFAQRNNLTQAFVEGAGDNVVQGRFEQLYRTLAEPGTKGSVPRWREVLAGREDQPGGGA